MKIDTRLLVKRDLFGDHIRLVPFAKGTDGSISLLAEPPVFKRYAAPEEVPMSAVAPALTLDVVGAQALMDSLWDAGVRPSEGSGSAGAMAATQKHLEDMRSLVFKTPPPPLHPFPNNDHGK